ncbi:SDR family oxidoreductase [Rathayibacter soli]|uniref:SDR family oxidoreductase n=1 Tax=Rathayibacter soli TaxID=3144168 RepID=UPI0027E59AE2|nr:SDR family oxidoreductase [Glaciibacter superstes]
MSIVVTGATGHLGRLVIESLLARGVEPEQIVAAGRNVQKIADFAERGVTVAPIDYDDPATLERAFAGADTLLLISASEVGHRLQQHLNVIDAAVAAGVGRIVYTSAPHADDTALAVAPEHKATEAAITASGLPFTILRNGWYTENYVSVLEQARTTGTVLASVGDGRVASASRADYADAAAVVLIEDGHVGRVYEVTGDVAWSFDDLADAISSIIDRSVVYTPVSSDEHLRILTDAGLDAGTAGFVVALDGNIRDGLLGETNGELRGLIGRPTTPLAEGLSAAIG